MPRQRHAFPHTGQQGTRRTSDGERGDQSALPDQPAGRRAGRGPLRRQPGHLHSRRRRRHRRWLYRRARRGIALPPHQALVRRLTMSENTDANVATAEKQPLGIDRRNFLKLGVAGLTIAATPAVLKKTGGGNGHGAAASKHRWAMVIDQDKCVGCGHCTMACRAANDVSPDISWNRIIEDKETGTYLPIPCMHCEDAPCVNVCPVKATYHRPDGIVMMDY